MTRERIMEFVDRILECRKLFPDVSVNFTIESNCEELTVYLGEDKDFFKFSTHPIMKTTSFDGIVHIQDPDLMMGESFLKSVMAGRIDEAIARGTKNAEEISGAGDAGAEGSD